MTSQPRLLCLAVLAAVLLTAAVAIAGQARPTAVPQAAAVTADREAEPGRPAPVLVDGEPVVWITAGSGPYSTEFRADRISQRIGEIVRDRSLGEPTVTVIETEGSSELRVGPRLIMVVTSADAASIGVARASLAEQFAHAFETAIRTERLRYAPGALLRSGVYALLASVVLGLSVWAIFRLAGGLRRTVAGSRVLRALRPELLSGGRLERATATAIAALRVVLVVVAFDLYLTYVLGLFPWTRALSLKLVDYVVTPIRAVGLAIAGYLPNLLFLLVIVAAVYVAIRLVSAFFRQIHDGHLAFASFPPEWADPTNKIVRVLLIAFGVVVAFPYLPASQSPAFAGVSVFMGVLVSLASSSALSNMIAGLVLTYTGGFRLGDRVKVGDAFGDIIETSLLATRIRTIKNEDVTIPNSIVIGSAVTNYTREAATLGLILHTSVTIGYDAPWRRVHELLLAAARATPGILSEPTPFVWQTALNDFYVTYEINAYTASPRDMVDIYAGLHARIQDSFYAGGVEIMSPHYTAIRDGNTVAIPEALRPVDYHAPSFRVADTTAQVIPR